MPIQLQASVQDVVDECDGTGTGPFTIFQVGGVTSGQINDKIREANVYLQAWVGLGGVSGDAVTNEQIRRFETTYGSAKLVASIAGIITVDGFNYSVGGLDVQRMGAQFQTMELFVRQKIEIAKWYINGLHDWFLAYNSSEYQGLNEYGSPVNYWSVSQPRY